MKILVLNPNTSADVTGLLVKSGQQVAAAGTRLYSSTAERGVPYIATRAEAQIGGAIALEMLAREQHQVDAAIIAAFGDPGLFGARELFEIPVVGLAEAAMLTACMLGRRFAIVTFAQALGPWYEDCVAMHGLQDRCAGVRMLDSAFHHLSDVQSEKEDLLVELANRTVDESKADVIILGGAPLAGLTPKIKHRVAVPLVDPICAAIKQAEALVALAPRKATRGAFQRPAAKPTVGLDADLGKWIEHRS